MRIIVIGSGLVGGAVGPALRAAGHHVLGTTTTPGRLTEIAPWFDEVAILRASDGEATAALCRGADAVVVTAGPSASNAMTVQDRRRTYQDVLVGTASSVVEHAPEAHLVALSAFTVYGTAADDDPLVTEHSRLTASTDPSPEAFCAAEAAYGRAADRSTVFRCADIVGAHDLPLSEKVAMAHKFLGGSVPFAAEALYYRIDVDDVTAAICWAVEGRVAGTFNLTHAEVPPTNQVLFDSLAAAQGLAPLTYRGEIEGPTAPVSIDRLLQAGFRPAHTTPATVAVG